MKKILALLLVLVMCLSVFVSCSKDPENNGKNDANTAEDIASIAGAIEKVNLKDLVTTIVDTAFNSETTQIPVEELMAELSKINGEATINMDGASMYAGVKDGIVKFSAGGEEGYLFFKGTQPIAIMPSEYGYNISYPSTEEMGVQLGGADLSEYEEMVNMYLTEDVLKALENFEFKIDADDISAKDGFYYLSDSVFVDLGNEVIDTVIEIMKALGAPESELPSADELKETKEMVEEVIKSLNLELGFAVSGEKINGITFGIEFDPSSLENIGGGAIEEEVKPYSTASKEEVGENLIAIKFTGMLDDKAELLKSLDAEIKVIEDGAETSFDCDAKYLYNAEKALVGAEVSFAMTNGNTVLGWYDDNDTEVAIYGTQSMKATAKIDFSKLSEVGATVADINLTMDMKATSYIKKDYKTDSEVEITDSATIQKIEKANEYVKNGKFAASAKVTKAGILDVSYKVENSYDGKSFETIQTMTGTVTWTAAPNYGTIPEDVRKNYIDNEAIVSNLERLTEEAKVWATTLYSTDSSNYNDYTWYDADSGLWTRFDRWETIEFYTEQPEADIVLK